MGEEEEAGEGYQWEKDDEVEEVVKEKVYKHATVNAGIKTSWALHLKLSAEWRQTGRTGGLKMYCWWRKHLLSNDYELWLFFAWTLKSHCSGTDLELYHFICS